MSETTDYNFNKETLELKFSCMGDVSGNKFEVDLGKIVENNKVSFKDIEESYKVEYGSRLYNRKTFLALLHDDYLENSIIKKEDKVVIENITSSPIEKDVNKVFKLDISDKSKIDNSSSKDRDEKSLSLGAIPKVKKEKMTIENIIKIITHFDSDSSKVHGFIQNCDNAMQLASEEQKEYLLPIIKSRISGNAEIILMNKNIKTWEDLKYELNRVYRETHSSMQLHLEMTKLRQQQNETVVQYTQRCETLTRRRLQILYNENLEEVMYYGQKIAIEKDMLNAFIFGLKREIGTFVNTQRPKTLAEASQLAIEEETRLEYFKVKEKDYSNRNLVKINHVNTKCFSCGKLGHISRNCFKNRGIKNNEKNIMTEYPGNRKNNIVNKETKNIPRVPIKETGSNFRKREQ